MPQTMRGKRGVSYRVRWRRTDGTQPSESFTVRADAVAFEGWTKNHRDATRAEWERATGRGTLPAVAAPATKTEGGPTIAELYVIYVRRRGAVTRAKTDDSHFRNHLTPLHNVRVRALKVGHVKDWLATMQTKTKTPDTAATYSAETIGACRTLLRAIVQAAVDDEFIVKNPVDSVSAPEIVKAELTDSDVLSVAELEAFLKCAPDRYRALFAVMAYTGCRLSEALGLTPELIDLTPPNGRVWFGRQRVTANDTGRATLNIGRKTPTAKRDTWLGPEAVELLTRHLEMFPAAPGEQIFRTASGGTPDKDNLRRQVFRPALTRAGIGKDLDTMNLRHTGISQMLAAGMHYLAVAQRVGHKPTETLNTYARWIPDADEENSDAAIMRRYRDSQR